jgi:hypothetical protein
LTILRFAVVRPDFDENCGSLRERTSIELNKDVIQTDTQDG